MADDFSNLRNLKKPLFQITENVVDIKQTTRPKPSTRIRFIITKNKNNSWVDDLHAQEQLNQMERVYH
jgi:hypothetical protein